MEVYLIDMGFIHEKSFYIRINMNKENISIEHLAKNIEFIFQQYDKGGEKHNLLPQDNNNRTLKGLEHFKEFLIHCNKGGLFEL